MKDLPRYPLAHLPTPLEPMERLGAALGGPRLWIKRDDQTGLATGGNKVRKLELLIADALAQGADTVMTFGAVQSNHCRQTAAAAARAGLGCVLVLRGEEPPPDGWNGNLLLDHLLGARILWAGESDAVVTLQSAAEVERAAGGNPYVIPYGGSNAVGASAYALAFEELWRQMEAAAIHFDRIVFASGSGGTQAGLVVGAKACGYTGQLLSFGIGKASEPLREAVSALLAPTAAHLGLDVAFDPADVQIDDGYMGSGSDVLTDAGREAIHTVARTEGILLDPVYTGKAMAGLIDLIQRGEIGADETVLFWHTGGVPALFTYANSLMGV